MLETKQANRAAPIVLAVSDPVLHPEALHIAAACGRPVVEVADRTQLARAQQRAFASLIDAPFPPSPAPNTFHLAGASDAAAPGVFVLPAQAADLLRALGDLATRGAPAASAGGVVISVTGAAGGVGASTLAAAIARKAHARSATLIDADRRSGGLDLLLGIEETPGARWGEIELGDGVVEREHVRRALPSTSDGVAVLTSSRTAVADPFTLGAADVDAVVGAVGTGGVTVLDAPAAFVPQRTDLALIVLPGQLRAAAAAARIAADLAAKSVPHALVLRDSSWASLSSTEVEQVASAHVLTRLRTSPGLTRTVEQGGLSQRLPRALARAADAVLAEVR